VARTLPFGKKRSKNYNLDYRRPITGDKAGNRSFTQEEKKSTRKQPENNNRGRSPEERNTEHNRPTAAHLNKQ
jgi:hypothetical protein